MEKPIRKNKIIHLPLLTLTTAILILLAVFGFMLIEFDADLTASLPRNDPVLNDAQEVILNHPVQDLLVLDVSLPQKNLDRLVEAGHFVENALSASGLFVSVGTENFQTIMPELAYYITSHLPILFTRKELRENIAPLLTSKRIYQTLETRYRNLQGFGGIGKSFSISQDPIGLSRWVMKRLAHLHPSTKAIFYRGAIVSADHQHLLVIADPEPAATDTHYARKATDLFHQISIRLNQKYADQGFVFTLTPTGAYRYALDNEEIARKDTSRIIFLATAGIAIMLLMAFPRPLIGLFAFFPAVAGTILSFFIFALTHRSISVLALGFGGALISITVDHGIAYLLFLDQRKKTFGRETAKEVWSVGWMATLTTAGAFSLLVFSGFPVMAQVGQFAAVGIVCAFLFVHTIFPLIFPEMPPATREKPAVIQNAVNRFALWGRKPKALAALLVFITMFFFAEPEFQTDLTAMNTVTPETAQAEKTIKETWGDIFDKIYLMTEANTMAELRENGDVLSTMFHSDIRSGVLRSAFIPAMVFPGEARARSNLADWRSFWDEERKTVFKNSLYSAARRIGFKENAFDPFIRHINATMGIAPEIPEILYPLLGIAFQGDKRGTGQKWFQFLTLTPGEHYNAKIFFSKYDRINNVKIFDPNYFSKSIGSHLSSTFIKISVIIGICLIILLFIFFADVYIALTVVAPIVFALVCTLGTLNIIGHPLDIPGLMLSIVVMGMGIDYSIYFVRSQQRYDAASHPSFGIIRLAVTLASTSTLIGFGVMCSAEHTLLKSAGITSLIGITYALCGTYLILPYLLEKTFRADIMPVFDPKRKGLASPSDVLTHYRRMEAYPRFFARFKLKLDPMFAEFDQLIGSPGKTIDIGTGYGVPAAWLLTHFEDAQIFGIDPDAEKVRIASRIVRDRGSVTRGRAPNIPIMKGFADTALMIDMVHYLNDSEFKMTLERLYAKLKPGGILLMRTTIPSGKRFPWMRWIETGRLKIFHIPHTYRLTGEIENFFIQSGFRGITTIKSGTDREEIWFRAKTTKEA